MKLLFDQNLSFKLCRQLVDLFPGSSQARLAGLAEAGDRAVWDYPKANGFVLVSLDAEIVFRRKPRTRAAARISVMAV